MLWHSALVAHFYTNRCHAPCTRRGCPFPWRLAIISRVVVLSERYLVMKEDEMYAYIFNSLIFKRWHWYGYHFTQRLRGGSHPFAESILEACLACDTAMPGYAKRVVDLMAAASGREKNERERDYEQLLQLLAELLVVRQVVTFEWSFPVSFHSEPRAAGSKRNPEITVAGPQFHLGVEVKAPALLEHQRKRAQNETQIPARAFTPERLKIVTQGKEFTLPRDNPVKDFLISADAKFAAFKRADPNFIGLLVIVWDDHVYEPISSLIHDDAGLFTDNSFARDANGEPLRFSNVDGVVVIRHLHQFVNIAGDRGPVDGAQHALDYGRAGEFPWKVFIENPQGHAVPEVVLECFQALPPSPVLGAEYSPKDLVWWFRM